MTESYTGDPTIQENKDVIVFTHYKRETLQEPRFQGKTAKI